MDRTSFQQLVEQALRRLPRKFKNKIRNVSIEIEDRPSAALLKELGIRSGTLYGLYRGVPITEREWNFANFLPDRITIYQLPIEASAASSEAIEKIVRDTVIHEVGHYFGFDDAYLSAIERERKSSSSGDE